MNVAARPVEIFDPIDRSTPRLARKIAVEFAREVTTDPDTLHAIALCVTEAVSNVVVHAYHDGDPGPAILECAATDERITIVVSDEGSGLTPRVESPGLGLGLPLIAQTAAESDFRSRPGGGLCVCMHFKVPT
jgi:anti-sigma regulatory factor (Ser/Thr protein kinase)